MGRAKLEMVVLEGEVAVAYAQPRSRGGHRCGICGKVRARYDGPRGRGRWRALDLGTTPAYIEAEVVRVSCPGHGVVTERVPWAAHCSRFTRAFEEQVACLAIEASKVKVAALAR